MLKNNETVKQIQTCKVVNSNSKASCVKEAVMPSATSVINLQFVIIIDIDGRVTVKNGKVRLPSVNLFDSCMNQNYYIRTVARLINFPMTLT